MYTNKIASDCANSQHFCTSTARNLLLLTYWQQTKPLTKCCSRRAHTHAHSLIHSDWWSQQPAAERVCIFVCALEVRVKTYVRIGIQMSRIRYHHNLAYLSDARLIIFTCRARARLLVWVCDCLCRLGQHSYSVCIPLGFWVEKVVFGVVYIFISFVRSFVRSTVVGLWKVCGIPFSTNVQVIWIWVFERVEPMNLFNAYAVMVAVAVVAITTTATAIVAQCSMMMSSVVVCVSELYTFVVVVCAYVKPKPNGWLSSTLFGFWLKLWTIATDSLLWSLLQSGCWNFIERRFLTFLSLRNSLALSAAQ